jgi:protein-disulfide isomerase
MAQLARQRAHQRVVQRRRQQQFWIVGAVAVAALLTAGFLILVSRPETPLSVPVSYGGLPQGIDSLGAVGLSIGSEDAPVTVTEYSDFSCTHCHEMVPTIHKLIDGYVRDGEVRIVYKPVSFVNPPYSGEAAKAAICAAKQGQSGEMHDQIWAMYEQGGPNTYQQAAFIRLAGRIGLDKGQFTQCYTSPETAADVESVLTEAASMGVRGTPSLFVNGQPVAYTGPDQIYSTLKAAIDAALIDGS